MKRIIDSPNTSTIFSLENSNTTWFIDYNEVDVKDFPKPLPYFVSKDENLLRSFETFGDALAYIFEKQGTTRFQAVKVESAKNEIVSHLENEAIFKNSALPIQDIPNQ